MFFYLLKKIFYFAKILFLALIKSLILYRLYFERRTLEELVRRYEPVPDTFQLVDSEHSHAYLSRLFRPVDFVYNQKKKSVDKVLRPSPKDGLAGLMPLSVIPLLGKREQNNKKTGKPRTGSESLLDDMKLECVPRTQRSFSSQAVLEKNSSISPRNHKESFYFNPAFSVSQEDVVEIPKTETEE